ncbi:hypothetical protein [Planctobacterium marinum]|uniref:Prephenate dehydrogenase n=1 Tax=Planctobacterium marinum TaxID=1631968 RepID=A0AA48KU54_9ALTE|nr:hypothetical protein MACH26_37600 [Planctobacterium marinum]
MDAVLEKLNENLQVLYRRAVDADSALDQLSSQGKAKHKAIFPADAGFTVTSERFAPYIAELSNDISDMQAMGAEADKTAALSAVVKKMESLFVTLAQFKGVLAES